MANVTYTAIQVGYESVGAWTGGAITIGAFGVVFTGGVQFTLPAPNQRLWRALTVNFQPLVNPVPNPLTGTLNVDLVNSLDEPPFGVANLPTNQTVMRVYSWPQTIVDTYPFSANLGLNFCSHANPDQFVGQAEQALQVLGHADFQGTMALVITLDAAGVVAINPTNITLDSNEEPWYTGKPTDRSRLSRADFCPRCGTTLFREQLVRDGFTGALVCPRCYDPPERIRRAWVPPKEINP